MIHTRFEVALMHGQQALRFLSQAWKLEGSILMLEQALRKQHEDGTWYSDLGPGMRHDDAQRQQLYALSGAVILFQASMEAIISIAYAEYEDMQSVSQPRGFRRRWIEALEAVSAPTGNFEIYNESIYKEYRNPLSHLGGHDDLEKVKSINFRDVYLGIRAGWYAYADLFEGLGTPHIHTWEELCGTFRVPEEL